MSTRRIDSYVENNRDWLYGSRLLRDKVEDRRVLVCNTGAMEKNIETAIGRRFKNIARVGQQKEQISFSN